MTQLMPTRRNFLKTATGTAALALLPSHCLPAAIATLAAAEGTVRRLATGWQYLQGSLGGAWEAWHSEETAVWTDVAMPHSFNARDGCDPDVEYYRGNGWYRKRVEVANPYTGGRTLLHFEGAGQVCSVYVGEQLVGHHAGGYDEFVVDITDALAAGAVAPKVGKAALPGVPVAVLCDNSRDLDRMPGDLSDFSLYGGLYRHVNLVYVPAVSLSQLHVTTRLASPGSSAQVSVRGVLYAPAGGGGDAEAKVSVAISDDNESVIHRSVMNVKAGAGKFEMVSFEIANPRLWSPQTPQLYNCVVMVEGAGGVYVATERFGLKHTEMVEHGPFKLNGERLLLRGTHRHEDHAGYANAMPDDLIAEELRMIKAMGANFIRLAHYQQSRRVLALCDELGILVWEELPWCRGGVGDAVFQQMGREKLRAMIAQHFNHVSVLFWGLGNEDDWPAEYPEVNAGKIRGYMQELHALAHQLDPSRYTSSRRCDFARDIPDVYSPSIWAGWYRGTYREYEKSLEKERERVKHLIHIEWGADSHAGRHAEDPERGLREIASGKGTDERGMDYLNTGGSARASRDGDWSETYACDLFDWHLKTQESLPWLTGSAMWIFKDFTTPLRVDNPVPRINQKGVVQRDMTKKEGFYVFQSYWAEEPMVRIYGHTWPVRWGSAGEEKMVRVYSNCDEAELFLNGRSLGMKRRHSQDFPCAGLRWMTPFLAGGNALRVVAKKNGVVVTDEIKFSYQIEIWGAPAGLKLLEKARVVRSGVEVVTVEAKLYDALGVLCLDAKNSVRFSVAGAATLIDNLGTPQGSRQVQMYNGRAEISLVHRGGDVVVAVAADGLTTAICKV